MFEFLFFLLNYFWLSDDPAESASWYCDQHCFKVGSEIIESVWDAVSVLAPHLKDEADEKGIPQTYRKYRHSKEDCLWHGFSVWNGFCRANMKRSLINANEIFKEHERRTGTQHSAWADCKFLMKRVDTIDFNAKCWTRSFSSQNGSTNTKYTPCKTKKPDLARRMIWCNEMGLVIDDRDRNKCKMTTPGQYINEKSFEGCKVKGDHITAYRNYYNAKASTVKGGMRYFYTKPPKWLKKEKLITERKGKSATKPKVTPKVSPIVTKRVVKSPAIYLLDSEGYVIVEFVD
jgi:hypothetical protein